MDFLTVLKDTSVPTVLVVGGLIFLFLGIATIKKPIVIDVSKFGRKIAFIIGIILITSGFFLMLQPAMKPSQETETITPEPTPTEFIETEVPSIAQNDNFVAPVNTEIPTLAVIPTDLKIDHYEDLVISEVVGNPCDGDNRNEFVEIYNSSEEGIDVGGLWITDGDDVDLLVSWSTRYPNVDISAQVDTTVIPPKGFAVILASGYPYVTEGQVMPYAFPSETIILTTSVGLLIGDEEFGIEVKNRDPIILYKGGKSKIDLVISTYGSPIIGTSPLSIIDDYDDNIPFGYFQINCWSANRKILINDDIELNWEYSESISPGY